MSTFELILLIYFGIGFIVGIPLGRRYWRNFRSSEHKYNVVLPKGAGFDLNRIIDSFIFLCAWIIYIPLYPFAIIEIIFKKGAKV